MGQYIKTITKQPKLYLRVCIYFYENGKKDFLHTKWTFQETHFQHNGLTEITGVEYKGTNGTDSNPEYDPDFDPGFKNKYSTDSATFEKVNSLDAARKIMIEEGEYPEYNEIVFEEPYEVEFWTYDIVRVDGVNVTVDLRMMTFKEIDDYRDLTLSNGNQISNTLARLKMKNSVLTGK